MILSIIYLDILRPTYNIMPFMASNLSLFSQNVRGGCGNIFCQLWYSYDLTLSLLVTPFLIISFTPLIHIIQNKINLIHWVSCNRVTDSEGRTRSWVMIEKSIEIFSKENSSISKVSVEPTNEESWWHCVIASVSLRMSSVVFAL